MPHPKRYGRPDPEINTAPPVEMPLNCKRPRPLQDLIASMVREAVAAEKDEEFETLEDSDDFEEEDPDLLDMTRYTLDELSAEEPIVPSQPLSEAPQQAISPPADPPLEDSQTGDPPNLNAVETG